MAENSKQKRYNFFRFLLILKGMLPSFLTLFTKRDYKHIVFCSSYTTKFQFNSRYLFLYFLDNYKDWKVEFVINDEESRKSLIEEYGPHFIETNTLKGKFHALKAGIWVPSSLETPVSGLFLSFRRLVYHVGHGVPFKHFGNNENEMSLVKKIYIQLIKTNFSYLLSNNEDFIPVMAGYIDIPESKIVVNGLPRNDLMHIDKSIDLIRAVDPELPECEKTILYAPTWRAYAETTFFPFKDLDPAALEAFLEEKKIVIYLRPHPSYIGLLPPEIQMIKRIRMLDAAMVPEIMEVLTVFDLLITDYSSMFIDWLITERPMAFIPYDLVEYERRIGFSVSFEEHTPGPKILSQSDFTQEIDKLLFDVEYYRDERVKMNRYFNPISRDNCRLNAEKILSLLQERKKI